MTFLLRLEKWPTHCKMEKIINDWLKLRSYLVILPSPTSFLDFFNLLIIKIHIKVTHLVKNSGGGGGGD